MGIVSISSLAIAALLSYLTVVLLSDYERFALDLGSGLDPERLGVRTPWRGTQR